MSTSNAARRRAQQLRRTRARRGGDEQVPLRLVICGVIFVALGGVRQLPHHLREQQLDRYERHENHPADHQP